MAESRLIYPDRKAERIDYYQVYAFNFFPEKALHPASAVGGWAVLVDTQTGRPVLVQTLFKPMGCCVPENWTPPKIEDDYKGNFGELNQAAFFPLRGFSWFCYFLDCWPAREAGKQPRGPK